MFLKPPQVSNYLPKTNCFDLKVAVQRISQTQISLVGQTFKKSVPVLWMLGSLLISLALDLGTEYIAVSKGGSSKEAVVGVQKCSVRRPSVLYALQYSL